MTRRRPKSTLVAQPKPSIGVVWVGAPGAVLDPLARPTRSPGPAMSAVIAIWCRSASGNGSRVGWPAAGVTAAVVVVVAGGTGCGWRSGVWTAACHGTGLPSAYWRGTETYGG